MSNSYETFIELVAPFFEHNGFQYYTPKGVMWNAELMTKEWRKNRNWKSQADLQTPGYEWYSYDVRFDSFESGIFLKEGNHFTQYIKLQPSTKKTTVLIFGIDVPVINDFLNRLTDKVGKIERKFAPFSTVYIDTHYGFPSESTIGDWYLGYSSQKKSNESYDKLKAHYEGLVSAFFEQTNSIQGLCIWLKEIDYYGFDKKISNSKEEKLLIDLYLNYPNLGEIKSKIGQSRNEQIKDNLKKLLRNGTDFLEKYR
ncbi:hypothetical protein N7E81_19270 [Reichenbachiella carrageenanivorans]|uniref:DUF4304 domain-containing protein n=1 Tax=Reichenbachiella carrageenanivorans TaxID=2979869 RepID=A0ABY6D004_9BACT|nr:hypothetical protein [Reichenbachiella carrageenanivorans]UXX79491.1 hypothetical protein N7E81_19270 [Reichenbachiella carrageenanivorans]